MKSMPLELARRRKIKPVGRNGHTIGMLKRLGVPGQMLYLRRIRQNKSFWLRKIDHLQILEKARWLYRQQIVCAHPDKPGGCKERAIHLNWTWREIERRFKQHGHELW